MSGELRAMKNRHGSRSKQQTWAAEAEKKGFSKKKHDGGHGSTGSA